MADELELAAEMGWGGGSGAGGLPGVSQLDQDNKSTHTYQGRSGCKSNLDSFRRLRYYILTYIRSNEYKSA